MFAQAGRGGRRNGDDRRSSFSRLNDNNSDEILSGTDGGSKYHMKCFGCNFHGHYRG